MAYAKDINGLTLHQYDVVRITQARKDKYPYGLGDVGEELWIEDIYIHVDGEVALSLRYLDGSGSIFHSTPTLYEYVREWEHKPPAH
jgi:hypothetical protein